MLSAVITSRSNQNFIGSVYQKRSTKGKIDETRFKDVFTTNDEEEKTVSKKTIMDYESILNSSKYYFDDMRSPTGTRYNMPNLSGCAKYEKALEEYSASKESQESETNTNIIVKPDGSRVLIVTMNIGGMETTMSLEISKPTEFANEHTSDDSETNQLNQSSLDGSEAMINQ